MKVLITGASRGLGVCLVKEFLKNNHEVYAAVRSLEHQGELAAIKDEEKLHILELDVQDRKSIEKASAWMHAQTKELDILINSAGVLLNRDGIILDDSYEDLEKTFLVNTIGPIYICNLFMDLLAESSAATILNVSSEVTGIDKVGAKFASYAMSKTAIAQYGYILKDTLQQKKMNIRVFSVHPGRMKTEMGAENGQIEPEESAEGIYRIASGAVLTQNEEIYVDYKGEAMLQYS